MWKKRLVRFLLVISLVILIAPLAFSETVYPLINFTIPTVANGTTTTNTSVKINVTITEQNLKEVIYNWNGTNHTLYNDSLVLMMNFDDYTRLNDTSRHGNDGNCSTCPAFDPAAGRYNGAYTFNGADQFVNVSDDNSLDLSSAITLSAWIKFDSFTNAWGRIVAKDMDDDSPEYGLIDGDSNYVRATLRNAGGTEIAANTGSLSTGVWYHIAFTYDTTNGLVVYTNGIAGNISAANGNLRTSSEDLLIGSPGDGANLFDGTLDEIKIWNISLSAEDIYLEYMSNLYKFNSTLWHLYVNQSNLTAGNYTYQAFASDSSSNLNKTEKRSLEITSEIVGNYTVCSAYCNHTSIKAAIGNASNGDTITVGPGEYHENVNVNKALKVIGAGMGTTRVYSKSNANVFYITSHNVTISGFSVLNITGYNAGIIATGKNRINASNNNISGGYNCIKLYYSNRSMVYNNIMRNCETAVILVSSSFSRIENNIVDNASVDGLVFYTGKNDTMINNIVDNTTTSGNSLRVEHAANVTVLNNKVRQHPSTQTTVVNYVNYSVFRNNSFLNSSYALYLTYSLFNNITGNIINESATDGIRIGYTNNTIVENNTLYSNYNGVSLVYAVNNIIQRNVIKDTKYAINFITAANNNTIYHNNMTNISYIFDNADSISGNRVYDNLFNNSLYDSDPTGNSHFFNTSQGTGTNILGGTLIGGNFWLNRTHNGPSQSCVDADVDGYCDSAYTFFSGATDYLPLALVAGQNMPPPQITIASPLAINYSTQKINFNITSNRNLSRCYFSISNWASNSSLPSISSNNRTFGFTNSTMSQGQYTVKFWCNDTYGNINNTEQVTFGVDTTSPTFKIIRPQSTVYNTTNTVWINISASETIDVWKYSLNGSANVTFVPNISLSSLANGHYNLTIFANDTAGNSVRNHTNFTINFVDSDGDGIADVNDTFEGNETNVNASGVSNLNITVGGNTTNGSFSDIQYVVFYNKTDRIMNLSFNFTAGQLNMSRISLNITADAVIVNLTDQMQSARRKTLYIKDNSFYGLCVKDAPVKTSYGITSACTGANETNFTSCIGNSTGVKIGFITCTDSGNWIYISNVSHSGIRGYRTITSSVVAEVASPAGSSSGGLGGASVLKKPDFSSGSVTEDFKYGMALEFVFKDVKYTLVIVKVDDDSIRLRLKPGAINIDVGSGKEVTLDLDKDGTMDFSIALEKMISLGGQFTFSFIDDHPKEQTVAAPPTDDSSQETMEQEADSKEQDIEQPTEKEESPEEEVLKEERWYSDSRKVTLAVTSIIIIALIAVILIFYRRKDFWRS